MGDQDQPDNAGDHYVSESNYEELLALAQCGSCKWHENYHPDERPRSKKRPKCKDLPANNTKNASGPSSNSSDGPAENILANEQSQLTSKENEGASGSPQTSPMSNSGSSKDEKSPRASDTFKSETPPSTSESKNPPPNSGSDNPPPTLGHENPSPTSGSETTSPTSESDNPPPISGPENPSQTSDDNPPPTSESDNPPPISGPENPSQTSDDNPPPTSESDNPPPTSESDNPPPTSESDNPPPTSESDKPPPTSESDNPPPISGPENPSPTSGSETTSPTSESDNLPPTSDDNSTPTSESDNPPPTSESDNPPITSESDNPPPLSGSDNSSPPTADTENLTEGPNSSLENPPRTSDSPQPENPCDNPTTPEAVEECRKYEENKKESDKIQNDATNPGSENSGNEGVLALETPDESKSPDTSAQTEINDPSDSSRGNDSNPENGPQTGDEVGPSNSENRPQTSGENSSENSSEPNEEPTTTSQQGLSDARKSKSGQELSQGSANDPDSRKSMEPVDEDASIPLLGSRSDSDLIHHHVFDQTESLAHIDAADRSNGESQPDQSKRSSGGIDDRPHSKCPKTDPDKIPDGAPVTDSIYEDLVALGRCSECEWSKNYHPCFEKDGPHVADCDEWNIPYDYYDYVEEPPLEEDVWIDDSDMLFDMDNTNTLQYDREKETDQIQNENALTEETEGDNPNIPNVIAEETEEDSQNTSNAITEETEGDNLNTSNVITGEGQENITNIQNVIIEEKEVNSSIPNPVMEEKEAVNPTIQNAPTEVEDNTNIQSAVTEGEGTGTENVVAEEKENAENVRYEEGKQEISENVEPQEGLTNTPEDAVAPTQNVENENEVVDEQGAQDAPNKESPAASGEETNGRTSLADKNEEIVPNSEEIEVTDAAVINDAGDGPEEMPAVISESRKQSLSEAQDEGDNVVMVYVSRSTYEELRARGKLLDKPQK